MERCSKQDEQFLFGQTGGTKQAVKSELSISDHIPATEGSAALDLAIYMPLTLFLKVECYKLTTGVYGPLSSGTVGIILGRSEITPQGFIVHPDIVDGDSKEEKKSWQI